MAFLRRDLKKAHAYATKGKVRDAILHLLANEIAVQDEQSCAGDEAFRRYKDLLLPLIGTAKELDIVSLGDPFAGMDDDEP